MQITFPELLKKSWALLLMKRRHVTVIVLVSACCLASLDALYFSRASVLTDAMPADIRSMLENPGLIEPTPEGDVVVDDAEIVTEFFRYLPLISAYLLVQSLLILLTATAFLLTALDLLRGTIVEQLSILTRAVPKFLWLHVWIVLRTFAWVPLIGVIPLLIIGPRLVAAPVLAFSRGMNVRAAVRESHAQTKGQWTKIIGLLLLSLLMLAGLSLVLFFVSTTLGVLFLFEFLALLLQSAVSMAVGGYGIFLLVTLGRAYAGGIAPRETAAAVPLPPPVVA